MNSMLSVSNLALSIVLLCTMNVLAQSGSFLVTDVRVFDGDVVHSRAHVLVREGRIAEVGESVNGTGVPRIDGKGKTLLPGFIDAHTHTEFVDQLEESLRFGITTVLDMGTFIEHDKTLRDAAASRKDVSDFRSSGSFICAPGGHGTEFGYDIPTLARAEDAEAFVENLVRHGADYLKLVLNGVRNQQTGMPTLDRETVEAVVKAGDARGLLVLAHIESEHDVRLAVAAGVDGFVHEWRDAGARPDLARLLAEGDIFVMPTLTAYDGLLEIGPKKMLADKFLFSYMSNNSQERLHRKVEWPGGMKPDGITMERAWGTFKSLTDAKVRILAGSDPSFTTGTPPIVHGASFHRLLELFVMAGLTPEETLRTGTSYVADTFKLADRGRIKPGLRADLVLVHGDPTQDILATRDIVKIWREGIEVDREAFRRD